ncbi:hypothetical protein [Lacticaseibacillus suihuaensis]
MNPKKIILCGLLTGQALAMPLLLGRTGLTWPTLTTWALLMLALATGLALALERPWPLAAAALLAIIGCWGSWSLLPLALAQIGLAWLVVTQKLSMRLTTTGWLVITAFLQLLLFAKLDTVLTLAAVTAVGAVTLPAGLALWSREWPVWVLVLLQAVLAVLTAYLQVFTLPTAAVALILGIALDPRLRKWPAWAYTALPLLLALLNVYTHFHG